MKPGKIYWAGAALRCLGPAALLLWGLPGLAGAPRATPATEELNGTSIGTIVLFRHANAPGGGDPPGMRVGDCSTQRNLDPDGRQQARRIGEQFRLQGMTASQVWTSQWCRTRETAALAFPAIAAIEQPAFNSFFDDRSRSAMQTAQARALLRAWRGPGVLVVVTHQINIASLTEFPRVRARAL